MSNTKEERIAVRVNVQLHEFLNDFARDNGMTLSELVRHVLVYWHMQFLLGQIQKPYSQLKSEFMEFAKTIDLKSPKSK
jgi:hypothetical protein